MNKVAVVTGGSSGIGLAICQSFLAADYEVVSLARRPTPIESPRLTSIETDLLDAAATHRTAQEVATRFAATTIVHNAGAIREKRLEETTLEDLTALGQLHLGAAFSLVQAHLDSMRAAHYGRIILVSSRALLGLAKRTAYSATKAGMLGLARTWALELGEYGITSNVVAPGPIDDTEMLQELIPPGSSARPRITSSIPVRRFGRPADVARAVMFFAAPEADFVTGQTLFVCGGTSTGTIVF
jgi:3-oxoacyl-[acyl-carrier protein] reductase